jgi:hypothetical protein
MLVVAGLRARAAHRIEAARHAEEENDPTFDCEKTLRLYVRLLRNAAGWDYAKAFAIELSAPMAN